MIERLRALLDRPISDGERRRLFALAAAIVVAATAILLLIGDHGREAQQPERTQPRPPSTTAPGPEPPPAGVEGTAAPAAAPPPEARRVARRFLSGYVDFIYGQGPAGAIEGAGPGLVARLARSRVRVSPAARRREPRIVELRAPRDNLRRLQVTALIDDGGVARYPISLTLVRRGGRWLVAEVAGD